MYSIFFVAWMVSAPPQPASAFAPVLQIRLSTPRGVTITLRPGTPDAKSYSAPVTFGVRTGYEYRIALAGLADEPATVIYPSIEVRASLFLPVTLKSADFPATVRVTDDDLKRVLNGGLVTKVIYLEDPETAPPVAATIDEPLEYEALRGEDPLELARLRGRPLAILRLGGRSLSPQELQAEDVPGTLRQPDEPALGPPAKPPMLPARTFQLFDPISGPRIPTEELVQDGGDVGPRIGVGPGGRIGNLNPTDTAAEFRYGRDPRRTTTSNRICLFAPRFCAIRQELGLAGLDTTLPPSGTTSAWATGLNRTRVPTARVHEVTPPMAVVERTVVRGTQTKMGVHEVDLFRGGPLVLGEVNGLAVQAVVVEPAGLTQYRDQCKPNEPLVLVKTAEPREANPGDVVTITLKFINYGSRAARDLIVSDSLSSRLEYVPGSARGDRPTIFTQKANEVGSTIVTWEITGELPAGQSGVVQFQVRVR
jgi:uncharacterized repeat protein (TIGR01451 family)